MAYQETTRQSYGSKVKGSFQGILWGIILIIAGTVILWWNEGRAVKASDALKDFQKNYVELSDINTVDPAFEGKAIHATGVAITTDTLRDAAFGIAVNAMKLERDVEYYQWTEHSSSKSKDKLGGATETTTTYTYEAEWCSSPVNSNDFKDPDYQGKNFVWRVVDEVEQVASNVTFGAYRLTDPIVRRISGDEPAYPVMDSTMKAALLAQVSDSTVVVTVTNDQVYIGSNPASPRIGDVRITFTQVTSPKTISILEKVVNGTFENYVAKNGNSFSRVEMGTVSAENMFENQKTANKMILWLLRILGIILVVAGFRSLLNFISTVFAVVPIVQKIIGTGIGLVTTVVGLIWSIIVIALAWVAHRPVLGITLLVVAAALAVWLISRSRKKKISDVAAILVIGLMLCIGCTGNPANGGDDSVASVSRVKGPVKTVKVTEYFSEGEPCPTTYEYDEKGNVISEKTEYWDEGMEEEGINEELSVKDDQGRYIKEVWGPNDNIYSIQIYEYDDKGNTVLSEHYQGDGTKTYTLRNTYDAKGQLERSVSTSSFSESVTEYEHDEKGNTVRTKSYYNGELNTISTYEFDDQGRTIVSNDYFPTAGKTYTNYTYYDAQGEICGNASATTDDQGTRITNRDTTYTGKDGLKHQGNYTHFEGEPDRAHEGTFNKQGYLTHYEYFEDNASSPSVIADFSYGPDGSTLRQLTWKTLLLGQVQDTRVRNFAERTDTFGNWTRRTTGPSYLINAQYMNFDGIDDFLCSCIREITYRGDDQGHNYGFTGKAGEAQLRLTLTEDDDVFCGVLDLGGTPYRAVGLRGDDGTLHVIALEEEGDIPWELFIPEGKGKLEARILKGDSEIKASLSPTRDGLTTYNFAAKPNDLVGIYQYRYPDGKRSGTVDAYLTGDNWEDLKFELVKKEGNRTLEDESTQYLGNDTYIYRYIWDDDSERNFEYGLWFYDGFVVVKTTRGDVKGYFGQGLDPDGIYAKLPAVG